MDANVAVTLTATRLPIDRFSKLRSWKIDEKSIDAEFSGEAKEEKKCEVLRCVFKMDKPRPLFYLFPSFCAENFFSSQQDSNLDHWSRR